MPIFVRITHIPPTVTYYTGHRLTLLPVREINIKAYAEAILTQITWPALQIEPRAMHKQPFKPAAYRAKPRGQEDFRTFHFKIAVKTI